MPGIPGAQGQRHVATGGDEQRARSERDAFIGCDAQAMPRRSGNLTEADDVEVEAGVPRRPIHREITLAWDDREQRACRQGRGTR